VRGFRIEPGEVEAALLQHGETREAAVMVREDEPGQRRLVAYVTGRRAGGVDLRALRDFLRARLPEYMVPAQFVHLDRLPLTVSGQADRAAPPRPPAAEGGPADGRQDARDERERVLVAAYATVLGRPAVGVHDNYFELGGDSITAIQLVGRVRRAGWALKIQ